MASKIADAFVEVSAQRSKLTQGLNAARGEINAFATTTASKMSALGKNLLVFGGIGAGAFAVDKILGDTAQGERAIARLGAALKATRQSAKSEDLNAYAETLKTLYGIDDDLIRSAMTLALNLGADAEAAKTATQAAIGLADVLGTDVKSATEAVMKAQEGNFREFEKLIPSMKDMTTSDEKLAAVSKLAQQGLMQQRAATDTLGGSTERLKQTFGDMNKSIGALVSSPLSGWFSDISNAVKTFTSGTEEADRAILSLAIAAQNVKKFTLEFIADSSGAAAVQRTIDELEKMREESINRSVKTQTDAMNKETDLRLKALRKVEDATRSTFGKLEDIYEHAQEAALKGGDIIGIGGPPEAKGFPIPPGGLKFNDDGKTSGPDMTDPVNIAIAKMREAARLRAEGKPVPWNDPSAANRNGREPSSDRERIQDLAGAYISPHIKREDTPEAQLGDNVGGRLRQKGEELDRRAKLHPENERQSATQAMADAIAEALSGKAIHTKEENAEALKKAIETLNGILPRMTGVYGS